MNKLLITILLLSTTCFVAQAAQYAVLAAGSKGYGNYRHQADICHAYQVLVANGVPKDNIIVFAYNDIAHNPSNPFPGSMFNQPSGAGETSPNVYAGCNIDYEGDDVTPENYIAVLTGDASAVKGGNGKVLTSGPNDQVFLNFDDHGSPGLIGFPEIGEWPDIKGQQLYADQLQDAFSVMTEKKLFGQLTYYLETCYSGSMFEDTPTNTGIYAVSAANPNQSSWGCYCPPEDTVEGTALNTCLGDLFSVNWMDNTEQSNTSVETLQVQFEKVRDETAQTAERYEGSEVMQWGDVSFTNQVIGTFFGEQNNTGSGFLKKVEKIIKKSGSSRRKISVQKTEDIMTNYLTSVFQRNPSEENFVKLSHDLKQTLVFNRIFDLFEQEHQVKGQYVPQRGTNFDCYRYLINTLENQCGMLNDFSRPHLMKFYEFCGVATTQSYLNIEFDC